MTEDEDSNENHDGLVAKDEDEEQKHDGEAQGHVKQEEVIQDQIGVDGNQVEDDPVNEEAIQDGVGNEPVDGNQGEDNHANGIPAQGDAGNFQMLQVGDHGQQDVERRYIVIKKRILDERGRTEVEIDIPYRHMPAGDIHSCITAFSG